jgi:2-keto-4-pentenoate hydratase
MSRPLEDERIARGMRTQLARRAARIAGGETAIGWKVGFGAPAAMQTFGITAPLVGYLMQSGQLESGRAASLAGWVKPVAEPEIAVHIGRDLEGGGDLADAASAIASVGPAIELADLDQSPQDVETILTDNIYHRHVLLGPRDDTRAGANISGLSGRVFRRGAEVVRAGDLEANTGRLIDIVRHVADLLAACGERLRGGGFIICGSVVPPLFVEPDETEISFTLEPIGSVTARFQDR